MNEPNYEHIGRCTFLRSRIIRNLDKLRFI